eukprot:scaffold1974_cov70-Skeletonema_dohrnii-CCMP3373.AAC.2
MSEEEYNAIWRKIKEHGKTSNVSEKAWEMFQASFKTRPGYFEGRWFNCMLSAGKKLRGYASITHWRNAASHRFTFADSIDLFIDLILKHAGIGSGADDGRAIDLSGLQDDVTSGVFAPSPSGAVTTVDQSK